MKISILGVTGSIGVNSVKVARENGYEIVAISANSSVDKIYEIAVENNVKYLGLEDEKANKELKARLKDTKIKHIDEKPSEFISRNIESDVYINAIVGSVGLRSSYEILKRGKRLALANKESLVVYGEELMKICTETNAEIIPIDSEHSAIFQCLQASKSEEVEKIYLTASGGSFRTMSKNEISKMTFREAIKHPNWSMGKKISIDSSSLMNKGLEFIEAKHLFKLDDEQIEVIVHPESIIHSAVQFIDGSIIAQMGLADMRLPIHYAINYPNRVYNSFQRMDFFKIAKLNFEKPNYENFPCLKLAIEASKKGGLYPLILNAANEAAVELFLNEKIAFYDISKIISLELKKNYCIDFENIDEVISLDRKIKDGILKK